MKEQYELREVYTNLMIDMARADERVVALDADLLKAHKMTAFQDVLPERMFDVGVAEGNMVGVAAGLSNVGFIPFPATFGAFAGRRAFDQFYISVAYAGLNVKLVGSDPAITAELNGGTHMAAEDVALYRTIPGITIIEPPDAASLTSLLPQIKEMYGPAYIRLQRKEPEHVYDEGTQLEIGKAVTLREGKDVTIICTGIMVARSLAAAEILETMGINARVINTHTIKPIDADAIIKAASETGAIVTAENHSVIGGLGSAVADVLVNRCPVPVKMIGMQDTFGEVGLLDYLSERFKMTPDHIVDAAELVIEQKQ